MRYLLGRLACIVQMHQWATFRAHCGHTGCGLAAQKCRRCGEIR